MAHDDQISDEQFDDEQFDKDLEIYRHHKNPGEITTTIALLRERMSVRAALREAIKLHTILMDGGAQEYEDIFASQQIYQETQEG